MPVAYTVPVYGALVGAVTRWLVGWRDSERTYKKPLFVAATHCECLGYQCRRTYESHGTEIFLL
jgi:hypothetical protein